MRKIIVIAIMLFLCYNSYSQDKIIRTNGDKIRCKVKNEDSTNVYIYTYHGDEIVNTYIKKTDIVSIKHSKNSFKDSVEYFTKEVRLGMGLEYGGFGYNVQFSPNERFGVFIGFGYALAGIGYNTGFKFDIINNERKDVFFQAMYGYNAIVYNKNNSSGDIFYGTSIGMGIDFKSRRSNGGWTLSINYPFRSKKVDECINEVKDHGGEFYNEPFPITISIGLKF